MRFIAEYERLFANVDHSTIVLSANQRLSRYLREQWDLWQTSKGKQSWATLPCTSLQIWWDELWQNILLNGLAGQECKDVITSSQERKLWERVLQQPMQDFGILAPDSLIDSVIQAWKTLRLWQCELDELSGDDEEVDLLKQWIGQYEDLRLELNILDSTARNQIICHLIEDSPEYILENIRKIYLIGFDNFNPLEQRLLDKIATRGVSVEPFEVKIPTVTQKIGLPNTHSEIETAARWAAAQLSEAQSSGQSPPKIGIVVPDLANLRGEVVTIFTQVFEPQSIIVGGSRHAPAFNLSAGQPLAQTPVYKSVLALLKCMGGELEQNELVRVMQSPFLWSDSELTSRRQVLAILRERFDRTPIEQWLEVAQTFSDEELGFTPNWLTQLTEFCLRRRDLMSQTLSFRQWGEQFSSLVQLMGWPGLRLLDTLEFQQVQHWPKLLQQLSELDVIESEPVAWHTALNELTRLAYTPFHPQTESSPVQVLGLLEAAGMQFDYLWVMGLDYRAWPQACQPNPLLPLALQKKRYMPRASANRELELAMQLTIRLSQSAGQVIFSFPLMDGDQPLQPSPLLDDFSSTELERIKQLQTSDHFSANPSANLEFISDVQARPIQTTQNIRGGSAILKNQALCPFKAFAQHRLAAEPMALFEVGVSPLLRGNLVHLALEHIWKHLRSQENLLALPETELRTLIDESIQSAWQLLQSQHNLGEHVIKIECHRSKELIADWLELEKRREPFTVKFIEKNLRYEINGLPLSVRLDRCDQLANGEYLVMDYKTGKTNIQYWFGDRPDDLQIPIYALADRNHPTAVAFAEINRHDLGLKGITESAEVIDSVITVDKLDKWDMPTTWEDLTIHWRSVLENLSQEFCSGYAAVTPKQPPKTCTYCGLQNICRIGSLNPQLEKSDLGVVIDE